MRLPADHVRNQPPCYPGENLFWQPFTARASGVLFMTLKALPAFGARYRQVLSSFPDHSRLENLCALEAMTAVRVGFRCVPLSRYRFWSGMPSFRLFRKPAKAHPVAGKRAGCCTFAPLSRRAEPCFHARARFRARAALLHGRAKTHCAGGQRKGEAFGRARFHPNPRAVAQVYAVHLQPEEPQGVCARLVGEVVGVKPHLVLVDSASMREEMLLEQGFQPPMMASLFSRRRSSPHARRRNPI